MSAKTKVAINGFGRIGRAVLKCILDYHQDLDVVAINDLSDVKTAAFLFQYDSLYGKYGKDVKVADGIIAVGGKKSAFFAEKDPAMLPWGKLGVDIVLECTGVFTDAKGAGKHIEAGAKKVILSAPGKDESIRTFVMGVNEKEFDPKRDVISSNASCTTNCLAPVVKVLREKFGVKKGFMTTAHAYTNDQRILDLAHKDLRRARAAALSIIPTTTGAAKTVAEVIPELKGRLDGISLRVPTPVVSIVDFICEIEKETTKDEINDAFRAAAKGELKGILAVEDQPLVSVDYKGNPLSSIIDSALTMAIGDLVKVTAWYDNEWGYACRLADMTSYVATKSE